MLELTRSRFDGTLALVAMRCPQDHLSFPPQRLGCEWCGAHGDDLVELELSGTGVLGDRVVVNMKASSDVPPPYPVGKVALSEGPVIRAWIADPELPDGAAVTARLVQAGEGPSLLQFAAREGIN